MEILFLLGIFVVARLSAAAIGALLRRYAERHDRQAHSPGPCLSPVLGVPPDTDPEKERVLFERLRSARPDRAETWTTTTDALQPAGRPGPGSAGRVAGSHALP